MEAAGSPPAAAGAPPAMRFCYLDCEDAQKWAGHEELAKQILQPGASWEHYRCCNRELPELDGLSDRFDGVLLSGSHYSVYEDRQWIRELEAWLAQAVAAHPRVKFLGMCFGCQVLAKALGGQVGKNPSGGFVLGVETIRLAPLLAGSAALQLAATDVGSNSGSSSGAGAGGHSGSEGVTIVRLIESHGDQVLELPPGAVLLAESPTAAVEMFGVPAGNVLAVQGHAELTAEVTLEKIHPAITAAGRLSAEEARESGRSLREDPTDSLLVLQLYRRFMEAGLPPLPGTATAAAVGEEPAGQQAQPQQERQLEEKQENAVAAGAASPTATAAGAAAAPAAAAAAAAGSAASGAGSAAGGAAPAPPAQASAASPAAAAATAQLLSQLQLAVDAELSKGLSEQQLLQQCNAAAEGRYRQMADTATAARLQLQGLKEWQEAELAPHVRLLDELEVQVAQLEAAVAQLDAGSKRLQQQMSSLS